MSPMNARKSTTADLDYSNIAEAQEKRPKILWIKMIETLNEGMNKFFKEIQENTNSARN